MNKQRLILFLVGVLMGQMLIAQENEIALGKVHYNFVHINDTAQREKSHQEEVVLYLGQHSSFYASYASKRLEEQLKEQVEAPGFDGNITITGSATGMPESYYAYPSKQIFQQGYRLLGDSYLLDEEFPSLNWEVRDETKEIGGYQCQRAETRFKGRKYTAWFTTDIPFQAGPWKLQGLPGLILEAADEKNEVSFKYAGFEKMEATDMVVGIPEGAVKTDKKSLTKLVEAVRQNPLAASKARSGSVRKADSPLDKIISPADIKSITVKRSGDQSKVTNNPIELED